MSNRRKCRRSLLFSRRAVAVVSKTGWAALTWVMSRLPRRALARDPEERRSQDVARDDHQDHPGEDDAEQRPPLRRGRVLPGPDHDPDQEACGGQGEDADEHRVPGIAEDTPAVVHDRRERGEDVE